MFTVWAPLLESVEVHIVSPHDRRVALQRDSFGYHTGMLTDVAPGTLYFYRLDGEKECPDPVSRSQPNGVHGPSEVIDPRFPWEDLSWKGHRLSDYIVYELHVGTFSRDGTFDAIISYLEYLNDLGITTIEIMPVSQFPGTRNWGYDGVYPYAVQDSYGGPHGLKRLINACHVQGIAVVLDVVYNHLGPEGNYLWDFAPYYTDKYMTPWGPAINFDGPYSDGVRKFFIDNALYWVTEFHVDALRIDAVHGIFDFSAKHFLEELGVTVHKEAERLHRHVHLIPESDLNDPRLVRSRDLGGYGLDAQWNDDFHHAVHTVLTNERTGYYQDFGELYHIIKALSEGFVYSGDYSEYRKRSHGNSSADIPAGCFVVFSQNHDQVGNRAQSERLTHLVTLEGLKLAASIVLLSPFIPLLFMGEEYAETSPFPYFVSHSDPSLVAAVQKGRCEEFKAFEWQGLPSDPQDELTFLQAKLNHEAHRSGHQKVIFDYYRTLIGLRKEFAALSRSGKDCMEVLGYHPQKVLLLRRWSSTEEVAAIFNFSVAAVSVTVPLTKGEWFKRLDSTEPIWSGPGSDVPRIFQSEGTMFVTLNAHAVLFFVRYKET